MQNRPCHLEQVYVGYAAGAVLQVDKIERLKRNALPTCNLTSSRAKRRCPASILSVISRQPCTSIRMPPSSQCAQLVQAAA